MVRLTLSLSLSHTARDRPLIKPRLLEANLAVASSSVVDPVNPELTQEHRLLVTGFCHGPDSKKIEKKKKLRTQHKLQGGGRERERERFGRTCC